MFYKDYSITWSEIVKKKTLPSGKVLFFILTPEHHHLVLVHYFYGRGP